MIDIGGPALLRAAAKNFAHVVAVCAARATTTPVLAELRARGELSLETRRGSRPRRSRRTAAYEAAIAAWFADGEAFPEPLVPVFDRRRSTSPTARTRTSAARYYAEAGARAHLLSRVEQLHGQAALVQQPQRPLRGAAARCRVRRPGLRDRQAREPVRGRGRARRSRRPTRRRSPPTPSPPTAASSCSTGRSARVPFPYVECAAAPAVFAPDLHSTVVSPVLRHLHHRVHLRELGGGVKFNHRLVRSWGGGGAVSIVCSIRDRLNHRFLFVAGVRGGRGKEHLVMLPGGEWRAASAPGSGSTNHTSQVQARVRLMMEDHAQAQAQIQGHAQGAGSEACSYVDSGSRAGSG